MIVWFQDFWIIPVVLGFNRNQLELSFVCFLKPDAEPDLWWVLAVELATGAVGRQCKNCGHIIYCGRTL